mmetsp:Transcript_25271/g.58937  ORF Transcript_25271/g.58937 Transcript_25271/m.58937 type:complete len:190 (-) Transcript_25271:189-758(-)|eukprot:CAMPEP_0119355832 /NCGR_PEP_ID=MMETSP1334-20130426/4623_1 /TAXON_ID=127549 /ORGANISM="Calcidiscus leptoporus, Strain RCC1130" /LENGTH=189 /DNA_ID=CAMNT_0007369761 /DNA_START=15 /DNA_END=584 /DNA_ORIENTATION=-
MAASKMTTTDHVHLLTPEALGPLFELELTPSDDLAAHLAALLAKASIRPGGDIDARCSTAQQESIRALFCAAALRRLSADELEDSLRLNGLGSNVAAALASAWVEHGSSLQDTLAHSLPVRTLLDVEWTFGVTASSSEHEAIGNTYVHVRMTVNSGGGVAEYVHFELSLDKFYDFLHELESARAQLEVV